MIGNAAYFCNLEFKKTKMIKNIFFILVCVVCQLRAQSGVLDPTFNPNPDRDYGVGINGNVFVSVIQPDGKLILAGTIYEYNNKQVNHIVRINPNGTIDNSFDTGIGANGSVFALALQPDGKILVGGLFSRFNSIAKGKLVRLNPNGSVDNTFTGNGTSGEVNSIAVQENGGVIIGGDFSTFNGWSNYNLVRLDSLGQLDQNFNALCGGTNDLVRCIKTKGDTVYAGGDFTEVGNFKRGKFVKIHPNGQVDSLYFREEGFDKPVYDIETLDSGQVLVCGDFSSPLRSSATRIARLNSDGTVDYNFGFDGTGPNKVVLSLEVKEWGAILAGGAFTEVNGIPNNRLIQLNKNGRLTESFEVGEGPDVSVVGVHLTSNDSTFFITGNFKMVDDERKGGVAKLLYLGAVDTTFKIKNGDSNLGRGPDGDVYAIAPQADGKIVIGGSFRAYNGNDDYNNWYLTRLDSIGLIDSTFTVNASVNSIVRCIEIQDDGKVIVGTDNGTISSGGYSSPSHISLKRFNEDGTEDSSFDVGRGPHDDVYDILIQPDDKILIAGGFDQYDDETANQVLRLNTNGSIDNTFSVGTGPSSGFVNALALQNDGKILVGGFFHSFRGFTSRNLVRLNSNGTVDETFKIGSGADQNVNEIRVQKDGKILVVGRFRKFDDEHAFGIVRLNTDGSIDATFDPAMTYFSYLDALEIMDNGKILVGGAHKFYRLNNDATIDSSYDTGLMVDSYLREIAVQKDGKVLIGGGFSYYNGEKKQHLARLLDTCITYKTRDVQVHCDQYTWVNGITYTSNNVDATYTFDGINGCDSIVTLNLTIQSLSPIDLSLTDSSQVLITGAEGVEYNWYNCDSTNPIAGEDSRRYIPTSTGNYKVKVSSGYCAEFSDCIEIDIITSTLELNNDLSFYPNPTENVLTLNKRINRIEISSINGKIVKVFLNESILNLKNLKPGVYFLKAEGKSYSFVKK